MELTACPLCTAEHISPYVKKKGYNYDRCVACGFSFLNPMPGQMDLNESYQGHKGISRDFYPHASSRKRRALFRALRFWRYLRGRCVLDIGCGGGFFVSAARLLGARQATGLDVDANTVAYARREFPRGEFICASFDTFHPRDQFQFIYCSELIEHVCDPHALMRLLRRTCGPGSYVYITTPDLGSPNVPLRVADWGGFAPPAHVGLFNEANLKQLFIHYGYSPLRKLPDRKTGLKILFRRVGV